ncbi:MAG: hypothetical protein A2170_12210 [Deltaproteobacteria bacterium RBG_13_53_10]|nr:MAG: hypothetical protein A2170_12210 [Deltaproteobacteria bacterium RBG_13_53_10]
MVAGIGIGAVLIALIYRDRIERWFWGMDRAQRIKSWADRRRSKKKGVVEGENRRVRSKH